MMNIKSQFDSGNWSDINGLPAQVDIIRFLEHLLSTDPNKCFTRRDLMDSVASEFGIPTTNLEAEGPKSQTPAYYTRMSYLISAAIFGKWRSEGNKFAKRIALNVYQHITGNGVVSDEIRKRLARPAKVSKRAVEEARVSVRILKNLKVPHTPEEIMVELGGRLWSDDVIEAAIKAEFPTL